MPDRCAREVRRRPQARGDAARGDRRAVCLSRHMPGSGHRSWRPARTDSTRGRPRSTPGKSRQRGSGIAERRDEQRCGSTPTVSCRVLDEVDGYVFMQKSPSCGLSGVKLSGGPPTGRGVYARQVLVLRPALPAAEAWQLFDPTRCANFVMRTFVYAHWRRMCAHGVTAARLIAFHTAYKYLVMAHDVEACRRIGHLLSDLPERPRKRGRTLRRRFAGNAFPVRFPNRARQRAGASAGICLRRSECGQGACRSD